MILKKCTAVALLLVLLMTAAAGCKSQDQIDAQQQVVSAAENAAYYDTRSTVNVTGTGVVTVKPDIATVGFTVYAEGEDPSEAQQENAKLMAAVMEVIRGKGIAEDDIETGQLNIREMYNYDKSPARIVGYRVYHSVEITVRDMDVLGSLISEAVAVGASSITGPEYSIEDDSEAYLEALTLAVASANAKAQTIATAAGAGIRLANLPVSITEYSGADYAVLSYDVPSDLRVESTIMEDVAEDDVAEAEALMPRIEITARITGVYQLMR